MTAQLRWLLGIGSLERKSQAVSDFLNGHQQETTSSQPLFLTALPVTDRSFAMPQHDSYFFFQSKQERVEKYLNKQKPQFL